MATAVNTKPLHLSHAVTGRRSITASLAYRTARLAGVPVDNVLSGKYPGTCPHCGHTAETVPPLARPVGEERH